MTPDEATKKAPPKRDHAAEAAVAVDPESRTKAQAAALAETYKAQDEAREEAGTLDSQEQAARAAHQAEGGGPWSEERLRARFLTPAQGVVNFDPVANYTSHEKQD